MSDLAEYAAHCRRMATEPLSLFREAHESELWRQLADELDTYRSQQDQHHNPNQPTLPGLTEERTP